MDQDPVDLLVIRAVDAYRKAQGDPDGEHAVVVQLISQARAERNADALAVALRASAVVEQRRQRHAHALRAVNEAIDVSRRAHLGIRLGESLLTRGVLLHEVGRIDSAGRDFDRAAQLVGTEARAEVQVQRATLAHNTGRLADASRLYQDVLDSPDAPASTRVKAANNYGNLLNLRGDFTAGQRLLGLAAQLADDVGPAWVAIVTETRAWGLVQSGRLGEGIQLFADAESLWKAAGMPLGELYTEYADALVDLRLIPEASKQAERAATELGRLGVGLMAAEAQLRVAQLRELLGDSGGAQEAAEQAAASFRRQRRRSWAARADLVIVQARLRAAVRRQGDHAVARRAAGALAAAGMRTSATEGYLTAGRVAAAQGRLATAVTDWRAAEALATGATVLARLKGRLAAALAARASGQDDVLLRACRTGLDDLARHRAALASTELKALASGHGAEIGALGLGALVRTGEPGRVLAWMERTRAASLTAVEPGPIEGAEDELGALRGVHADILAARRDTGAVPGELLQRQHELEEQIRRATWSRRVAAGAQTRTSTSLADLRRALAGRSLVEYDVLDGRLVAVVVEPRRSRLVDLGPVAAAEAEVASLRFALRALVGAGRQVSTGLRGVAQSSVDRLAGLLVQPLGLEGSAGVVVVPVGELQRVPWTALLHRPVAVTPSAALWARSAGAPHVGGRVVLVAGPELRGAVHEVSTLARLHRDPLVLVPPDSSVETVRGVLGGAALVHLACHGGIRADNPTFSSVLLADGQLSVHEFERGAGAPYRLVLAACDVGSSVTYPGNEVLGFVGTLLARGTGGLVASTVAVPDDDVTPLMVALHSAVLDGGSLAQALYVARATIDPEDPDGYPAWCSFTAYGAA